MALSDLYQLSSVPANQELDQGHAEEQTQLAQHLMQVIPLMSPQYHEETLNSNSEDISPNLKTIEAEVGPNEIQALKKEKRNKQNSKSDISTVTRFKWTKEMMQVAMNLFKYGCKPKIVSVAVGCSLRTAQKFAETVTPREEGQSYREYEVKRRGRKLKDTTPRLEAIREVLNKDCTKTQVEIAANLKVSNTTVCRDLKKIGGSWRDKKVRQITEAAGPAGVSTATTTSSASSSSSPTTTITTVTEIANDLKIE